MNFTIPATGKKAILFLFVILFNSYSKSHAQTPDPGLMGTHAVVKAQYDLGDSYFAAIPPYLTHAMECRGSVHYPSDLSSGPFPVLFWLHGRHSTCYNTSTLATSSTWPCPSGRLPILSYEGYDYAARVMASHGYIVISVSANAINGWDGVSGASSDNGMTARGRLVQWHMDLWQGWNTTVTTGPFGSLFVGALDMQNVGTMGHSRGGEGVVYNAEYNRSLGSPYGIKAVLTLAPVDFYRHVLNKTALLNIAPYCDGDVSDLQGVHFYDDSRYKDTTDETPKHCILVMGANHNYFNTVWTPGSWIAGGADDWLYTGTSTSAYCGAASTGTGRLDSNTQKAVYNTYAAAFYRYYLGHETKFEPILKTKNVFPPASAVIDSSKIFVSYHAGKTDRLDINTVDSTYCLSVNTLGGSVTNTSLTSPTVCGGGVTMSVCDAGPAGAQLPHRGSTTIKGLGQMRIKWVDTNGAYQNDIPPAKQNFTGFESISFRSCENFMETSSGPALNFSVQLIDSAGNMSSRPVGSYSHALFFQPGTTSGDLPKEVFNTISIPLADFTGVNLAKIRHIKFKFNQSTAGAILVSDLALNNGPCGNLNANFTHTVVTGLSVSFTNTTQSAYGDTLSYLWHFGNPASGTNDTSTFQNPGTHLYTTSGSFTACLYVTSHRRNGMVCVDTFCTTVVVGSALEAQNQQLPQITIIPNPAKDYLQINGAESTDILRLTNLYGQEVFTSPVTNSFIRLPETLPAGMYYALLVTAKGNVYQKVIINR